MEFILKFILPVILGALIPTFIHIREKRRANIIVCVEKNKLKFRPALSKKIAFTYNGHNLMNPWFIQLSLTNIGSKEITNPKITFKINKTAKILKPLIQILPPKDDKIYETLVKSPHEIVLKLDYLNPKNPHGDVVNVELICDGKVENLEVFGSGKGWSVQFKAFKKNIKIALLYSFIGGILLTASFIYLMRPIIELVLDNPSLRSTIDVPLIVFLICILVTLTLAKIAEYHSKISFYKTFFIVAPTLMVKKLLNIIFKNKIH